MSNAMPRFTVRKTSNGPIVGEVAAVSNAQALARAYGRYGRCVVEQVAGTVICKADRHGSGICDAHIGAASTHGRAPYPTPGFEERRAALIAAHKLANA